MGALTFDDIPIDAPGQTPPAVVAGGGGALTFDDIPSVSQTGDIAKGAGAGYLKGMMGLAGLPATVGGLVIAGADRYNAWHEGKPLAQVQSEANARATIQPSALNNFTGEGIQHGLEKLGQYVTGQDRKLYEPQTTAGKYVGTAAEFVPGTVLGPLGKAETFGNVAAQVGKYGVLPGLASEAAGQATSGTALEPWARAGSGLAAGVGAAYATRPTQIQRQFGEAGRLRTEQADAVETLFREANAAGIPMTRAVAAQAVTDGATNLGDMQRIVEGNGGLKQFYAGSGDKIEAAVGRQLDSVTPAAAVPSEVGQEVRTAAQAGVDATPEGQALGQAVYAAGPRVTPEQAGQVIQPELRGVYDRREGARAAVASEEYEAARKSDSWVPVDEKLVDVARTAERPMTQAEVAAAAKTQPALATAGGAKPLTLTEFIARNGGLALDGGEAAAAGLDKIRVPFGGNVARPNGKSIDGHWRETLAENGYIPYDADGYISRDIRDELFQALSAEREGRPTYSVFDHEKLIARGDKVASVESQAAIDKARSDIITDHYRAGVKPADLDPVALDKAAEVVASGASSDSLAAYNRALTQTPTVTEQVAEKVPQTVYGQVSPNPVIKHIDRQLETAKGGIAKDLEATKRDLYGKGGTVEGSVEGLQNAREALNERIEAATANGRTHSAKVLMEVKSRLDRALEQVPEQATANANFRANSVPLAPFDNTPPISRAIAQDKVTGNFTTPPERVPGTLQEGGSSTARAFNDVAPPAARQAFEQHLTTQVLEAASNGGADLSAQSIRKALQQNADLLAQYPTVRDNLANVAAAREGLERIKGTPLAKLADAQPDVGAAVRVLFPGTPVPHGEGEIAAALRAVSDTNPGAAKQLVRTYLETQFNSAAKATMPVGSQFAGAGFAGLLRNNPQRARDVTEAIKALPGGDQIAPGFSKFMDILEATGHRQRIGSQTAFNQEFNEALKQGGPLQEAVQAVASGGLKLPEKVNKRMDLWRKHMNTEEVARILTDPEAATLFRHLVTAPTASAKTVALVSRLTAIGARGAQDGPSQH